MIREISIQDLRERADRARAALYAEICRFHALIPQSRTLLREGREASAELLAAHMRYSLLAIEMKRNFWTGSDLQEAASTARPRKLRAQRVSVH